MEFLNRDCHTQQRNQIDAYRVARKTAETGVSHACLSAAASSAAQLGADYNAHVLESILKYVQDAAAQILNRDI